MAIIESPQQYLVLGVNFSSASTEISLRQLQCYLLYCTELADCVAIY